MNNKKICILGGTGFVGHHMVARLANEGHQVKILTRHRERNKDFLVMPEVELRVPTDYSVSALSDELRGCDVVINLVGILNGSEQAFHHAHAELPATIVSACTNSGVARYLHMSALKADADHGPSIYLRTKGLGEQAAHAGAEQGIQVTSFQPSVIFGPDDSFFNRFAGLLKLAPVLPLACPNARFAPVYVEDVVSAFCVALADSKTAGQRYQLCGPTIYTLKELVEYTARMIGKRRMIVGLSNKLSYQQAKMMQAMLSWLPGGPPLSLDNYQSLQIDSVCDTDGLTELGLQAQSIESIMPKHFNDELSRLRYNKLRRDRH